MRKNLLLVLAAVSTAAITCFAQSTQCPPPTTVNPGGAATPSGVFTPSGSATPTPIPPRGGAATGGGNGGATGGGGAPGGATGGAGHAGGGTGLGAPTPIGAPAAGGTTGGRKKAQSFESAVDWEWWWTYNGARYLNLKYVLRNASDASTDNSEFKGDSGSSDADQLSRKIRSEIAPFLEKALADGTAQVRSEGVIALAKCGNDKNVDELTKMLADKDIDVRESACLALGILGDKNAVPTLIEVMKASEAGKKAVGKDSDVSLSTRAFASIAIGLIGSRTSIEDTQAMAALQGILAEKVTNVDLHIAATVALGLTHSADTVPALIGLVRNEEMDGYVRAYALTSLGKIGERSATAVALAALNDKSAHVRRSAALALGNLAMADDKAVIAALTKTGKGGADRAERNFAIMSLGQIGGTNTRTILADFVRSKDPHDKTFGALALGLSARGLAPAEIESFGSLLHTQLRENTTCRVRGALAVGMGLMGYVKAAPELVEIVESQAHAHLRGECAQALGLMRSHEAIPALRKAIEEVNDLGLRTSAAVGLGLIGDKDAIDVLNRLMKDNGGNVAISGAALRGLGLIGDGTVVKGLAAVLASPEQQAAVRAYAAEALGLLGDKDDVPALSRISENENYVSQTGALTSILSKLL